MRPKTITIATWNINGIRAATRKGLVDRLDTLAADVVLFQEVRAHEEQMPSDALEALEHRYEHRVWHAAERKGYSGTLTLSKLPLKQIRFGLANKAKEHADEEGRLIETRLDLPAGPLRIVNVYLPSGTSGDHRQRIKDGWLGQFEQFSKTRARSKIATIMCGDMNVAPAHADLFYAKNNEKNSGFLPHEREWFARTLDQGWHDSLREYCGDVEGPYTWWSNRGRAMELDRGWRIDHILANKPAWARAGKVQVHRELAIGCSDHAPVTIEIRAKD